MAKKIILVILITFVLFVVIIFVLQKPKKEVKIEKHHVDTTEDFKALGFSGQKKLVSDQNGNLFLTYRKKFQGFYEVFISKIDENTLEINKKLQPIAEVSRGTNQRVPSIAIDETGNLHLVWYGAENPEREDERQIKYTKSTDRGETFSNFINISLVEGFDEEDLWQEHPDIIATRSGELFVVWEGKDKTNERQQIKISKSIDNGNSWTVWRNIKTNSNSQSRPTILEDSSGQLHVLAYSNLNSTKQQIVESLSKDKGETWSSWESISKKELDARHISAIPLEDNQVFATWRSLEKEKSKIVYSIFKNGAWSVEKQVSSSEQNQFFPSIGKDNSGNVFVSWMESEERADLPNEDPENTEGYIIMYNSGSEKFTEKKSLGEAFYPQILNQSKSEKQTFVAFVQSKSHSKIYLTNVAF